MKEEESAGIPRLMVSAPAKSSGKTTLAIGIAANLSASGWQVNSFKKGPDYIDPAWHRLATGNECYNLDPWMMGPDGCRSSFIRHSGISEASLSLIEGNHGLHDGMSLDGSDSSAGLAEILQTPVLLVVDGHDAGRGAAATVMGMQAMPPSVTIAGVVLNRVRSERQAEKQRRAIEQYCGIEVLGSIPIDRLLTIPERHLGLTTVAETATAGEFIRNAAATVAACCDMEAITRLFFSAPHMAPRLACCPRQRSANPKARIGVFRDAAFSFYYPDNLEALEHQGAELVFIDSLAAAELPAIDALYIGGGFPESFFRELTANHSLMQGVRSAAESGMPLYAECGGLIYLSREALYRGESFPMAGVLPFDIGFTDRPAGHGYLELESTTGSPWFTKGERVKAHEFHYSSTTAISGNPLWQFTVHRGKGTTGRTDGIIQRNVFASYAHLHAVASPGWAPAFVSAAAAYRTAGA
ncbi:cobyrinate a,c-diamide synthase [Chlorobium phaeovibrioides]|uniref:Cobyrinate a,c-diamide synthase n=1 Tax=Chlorobium phaeovibrioides TaxID=1094 RepID=A0A3S0MQG8_CHLPH|nr:cobyrinate a,c-diamide synthase [Chlorobium phaeovibrioides]MWV54778.1 cobyrinate a,c-diamide synthase [Chlorobium phaeovibrioides]RTY38155.1 cobyrinate a,c-diamide synthase [Chlorobium phaeovibrioides]